MNWDARYDVIILGFGGAGATAARFASHLCGEAGVEKEFTQVCRNPCYSPL